jgi:hypothetical protein
MLHLVGLPRAGAPLICFTGAEIAGFGEWLQFEYIEPSEFQRLWRRHPVPARTRASSHPACLSSTIRRPPGGQAWSWRRRRGRRVAPGPPEVMRAFVSNRRRWPSLIKASRRIDRIPSVLRVVARTRRQDGRTQEVSGTSRRMYTNTPALMPVLDAELKGALPTLAETELEWRSPLAADRWLNNAGSSDASIVITPAHVERASAHGPNASSSSEHSSTSSSTPMERGRVRGQSRGYAVSASRASSDCGRPSRRAAFCSSCRRSSDRQAVVFFSIPPTIRARRYLAEQVGLPQSAEP